MNCALAVTEIVSCVCVCGGPGLRLRGDKRTMLRCDAWDAAYIKNKTQGVQTGCRHGTWYVVQGRQRSAKIA